MIRAFSIFFASLCFVTAPVLAADKCVRNCPVGHAFTLNTSWPYAETISFRSMSSPYPSYIEPSGVIIGPSSGWETIQGGCLDIGEANMSSVAPFNALLRAYVKIYDTTAVPRARYELRFQLVDQAGLAHDGGQYMRAILPNPLNPSAPLLPQGDHFNGTVHALPAGQYRYRIQARLIDSGSITFAVQFTTAQGVPATYPSGKNVQSTAQNVSAWAVINEVTFTNNTGKSLDIFPQGYFQVDLGTSGDRIGVSFELVGRPSQVTELSLSGVSREAFNTFGHFYDLAPGQTYTLRLWATNRSGGTTAMRWRQLEYVTFPSSGPRNRMERTDTVLVSTATTEVDQPINFLLVDGNRWTKLHEFQIPAAAGDFNWTGEGYVEILGRGEDALGTNAGDWTSTAVDLAVEVISGDGKNVDMHLVGFSLPPGHHGRYFFIDAMLWGAGTGNTVKLWMRKAHSSGTFRVAKRHMALKLVPFAEPTDTNTCWYYNPGP